MASKYIFRLRAPKGLDNTLIKELKQLGLDQKGANIRKIPGRKAVEVHGDMKTMWKILYNSRIAEDLQLKITQSFQARGEKELQTNLQKLPWNCYLPLADYEFYKMPPTRTASYKSKLFHTQLVREVLLQEINDLPIHRDYNRYRRSVLDEKQMGFKRFKKEWLNDRQKAEDLKVKEEAKNQVLRSTLTDIALEEKMSDLDE
jgi:hypothetical protein